MNSVIASLNSIIAVVGTLTNTLSLSYFINKAKKTLPTRLLILLNTLDLVSCIFVAITTLIRHFVEKQVLPMDVLSHYCFEATGYVTAVLSVTRSISLCLPFYRVNGKLIAFSFLPLPFWMVTKAVVCYFDYSRSGNSDTFNRASATELVLMMVTIVIANTISVVELSKRSAEIGAVSESSKQATVTVLIISVLFCIANSVWVGGLIAPICASEDDKKTLVFEILTGMPWILVPFNSALNPGIYFWRKRAMREYARELFQNLFRMLDYRRADRHPGAEDSQEATVEQSSTI